MKIISYSLWGNNTKYTIGAIKNADLAAKFYPEWICHFYCAKSVPENIITELTNRKNCKVILEEDVSDWTFATKRFKPMSDPELEYFISRDTDSRFTNREVEAVKAWISSGKNAHIMRDHPHHGGFPMLAGMFGIKGGVIKNINKLLLLNKGVPMQYHYDQIFLANYIFPYIQDSVLIHDEYFSKNPFPTQRINKEYVGKPYDENDKPVLDFDKE